MYRDLEGSISSVEPCNFGISALARRDISRRFSDEEKAELGLFIQKSWGDLRRDIRYNQAEVLNLTSGSFTWGEYPDREAFALVHEPRRSVTQENRNTHLFASVNLENSEDVLATQAILAYLQHPKTILATAYFPYERGDRPEIHGDGSQELLLLDTLIQNIYNSGVRGLITIDNHSAAFPWFCLKAGIAPVSLSTLPGLIRESRSQKLLDDHVVSANSDDGAKALRELLSTYVYCEESINGIKTKAQGKTVVTYTEEDLRKVAEKTIVFSEDIISTGGTMASGIFQLLNEGGAKRIIILVTYPIFAGRALELLGSDPRIKIITTDGRTPMVDLSTSKQVTVIPIKDTLPKVLELAKQNVNFWSQTGKEQLDALGLCMFPW